MRRRPTRSTPPDLKVPTRSLGPWRSTSTPMGRPTSFSTWRIAMNALAVVGMGAVAEVEAEDVGPGLEQGADALGPVAGRPEGGEDLRHALASHAGALHENGAKIVDVGERRTRDHEIADGGEESVAVVVGQHGLAVQAPGARAGEAVGHEQRRRRCPRCRRCRRCRRRWRGCRGWPSSATAKRQQEFRVASAAALAAQASPSSRRRR